jgi:hypothetical protein
VLCRGAIITAFTYLFGTRDLLIQAAVSLTAALMGFVMYLIFALEHPFVGALSVAPDYYQNALEIWTHHQHPNETIATRSRGFGCCGTERHRCDIEDR